MPSSRRGGGVSKRCECRGPDGKLLGNACPLLARKNHGAPFIRQELPPAEDGKRRTFRRTGYTKVTDAQTDLDRVRSILDLAGDDEHDQQRIGDYLAGIAAERADIPEPAKVAAKLGVGVPLDGKMTVGEWLDVWLASKKTRSTTTAGYRSHVNVHLKRRIGHLRLDRLNVGHLDEMFSAIADESDVIAAENSARREQETRSKWTKPGRPPVNQRERLAAERAALADMKPYRKHNGPATRQAIRRTLRTALNAAIGRQLITFNAASHVELTAAARPQGLLWTAARVERWRETGEVPSPVMVWTPEQLGVFLDAAEDDRLYAFFHLIAHHGLRRGEGVGQDWAGVDWDAMTVAVRKEIVVDGWTPVETDPKTAGSQDVVQLDSGTIEVLREHREQQRAERGAWNARAAEQRARGEKAADWVDTGKVFSAEDGRWLHPDAVSKAFKRIYAATDLPPINLRDLRHGAAGLVKAGGGDIEDAKRKLRHSTITLTADTYMPLFAEYTAELAEKSAAAVPRQRGRRKGAVEAAERRRRAV